MSGSTGFDGAGFVHAETVSLLVFSKFRDLSNWTFSLTRVSRVQSPGFVVARDSSMLDSEMNAECVFSKWWGFSYRATRMAGS